MPDVAHTHDRYEDLKNIDVPTSELYQVDYVIHQHHPEAINGGVYWTA